MARPKKQTVDYFPHSCVHKKTMFILEQKYGNDGYAFWFKLLEMLGSTEGHFLSLKNGMEWEFLIAKTHPEGPFIYQKTLFNTFSIDAHVIKDEKGNFYLFYSTNEYLGIDDKRPGSVILVDRLIDLMTPEGNPKLVVKPTIDEEIYEKNRFKDGRDWHTIEGAFYLNMRGKNYLFYSGAAYINKEYFIGYSVSFDGINWEKYPDDLTFSPLLKQNDRVEGTGHNSVIKAPNNVDYWIVYHGRNVSEGLDMSKEQRTLRIDPLLNKGNALWVPGPSYDFCDVPALPNFRDLFDYGEDISLSTEWSTIEGNWIVKNKSLCQKRNDLIAKTINNIEFENYIFEISFKWEKNHTGGLYGVYAAYNDSINNLQILFDVGKKYLVIY